MNLLANADNALELVARLYGGAVTLASLELLYLYRRGEFSSGGAWSWEVVAASVRPRLDNLQFLFGSNFGFPALVMARLLSATTLIIVGLDVPFAPAILAFLLTSQLMLNMRIIWGDDGSDQMLSIIVVALTIGSVFRASPEIKLLSLYLIAFQLTLSYFCSGFSKLFGPEWRAGDALTRVLGHFAYGNIQLHAYLSDHPKIGRFASYFVMVFQLSFPMYYFFPAPEAFIYILVGFSFHLGIAIIMRLNGFLFSFCAGYPALIYAHENLHSLQTILKTPV